MTTGVHPRLRERIDTLTDQRDEAREKLREYRALSRRQQARISALEKSVDLWRTRAHQWRAKR